MPTRRTVPLPGSERTPVRGARVKGPISGNEPIEVRVTLKAPETLSKKVDEISAQPLSDRKYLSREEFDNLYRAGDASIARIEQFAREHNLSVSGVDRASHVVYLAGNARDLSLAFQTYLECYERPDGVTYRGRRGPVHVPEDLSDLIVSVDGLDDRPVARPKIRLRSDAEPRAGSVEYAPRDLARLYSFPETPNAGQGQTIAIIELGGGFRQADLDSYFGAAGPKVTAVSVDRGRNDPTGNPDGPDGEVMLDIEVAGAVAPAANIVVYFAPNTNKGFLDAISAAVHDKARNPSVISISWGSPEDGGAYSQSALNAFGQAFLAAAAIGVTVLAAAGDNGSSDGEPSGDHVDFPACNPYVTACGGTRLMAPDKRTIQSETVWNDGAKGGATGGGISKVYPAPAYQQGLRATRADNTSVALTGRGVPDVAADADPVTGYDVLVDGQRFAIGGTSAVAPLLAGLIALLNQSVGKPIGFWNPFIYTALGTGAVRDITNGNNGSYAAAKGWDACTGVGVPVGTAMLSLLAHPAKPGAKVSAMGASLPAGS